MKLKLKLYILSLIALMVVSCSKDPAVTDNGAQVNFNTFVENNTKVEEYFLEGEKMGLFAYNLPSQTPDFMYNVPLEHLGYKVWSTGKPYYWSQNPNNWKRFYAYYPYVEGGSNSSITLSPASYEGAPYINFTLNDATTDFMVCSAKEGNVDTPAIEFTAKHALAKLSVGFATDIEQGMAYARAEVLYDIYESGKYIFDSGFDYTTSSKREYVFTQPTTGDIYVNSPEAVYPPEYTIYLLPSVSQDNKGAMGNIKTVINGREQEFDLSSVPLKAGKHTSVKIIINQKEVSFTATIEDWQVGGSVNGTID